MAPEGEVECAFGQRESAVEPAVFVCAAWGYGLRQFPVQMAKLLLRSASALIFPGDLLPSPPASTRTHTAEPYGSRWKNSSDCTTGLDANSTLLSEKF